MADMPGTQPAADAPAGSVYDLGYRRYEGERLGRRQAISALYRQSLRGAFGLGRSASAKVAPAILIGLAMFPALVQLALGALLSGADFEIIRHDEYYVIISYIIALFCAVVAPDVVGRDQRSRTLPLYFSRALSRTDYALGKYAAVTTAVLGVTLVPQLVLFLGNALGTDDVRGYLEDNAGEVIPIAASALAGSMLIAAVGTAIAAQTPRRAFAIVGIIIAFLLSLAVAGIMVAEIDTAVTRWAIFASPFSILEGMTYWMFGGTPEGGDELTELAGFSGSAYLVAAIVVTVACVGITVRRYRRLQV